MVMVNNRIDLSLLGTGCAGSSRYASLLVTWSVWTDDGTDFVGKSGVFWPDFGTVSGPLAALRFYAVAGLRDVCLPAAGRGSKTRSLVPSWAGNSLVVVGATCVVLAGVFVCSAACCRRNYILITY